MWIQNLCNFISRVFSYLQPWQQKALNCSTNYTTLFVSQAKQEIRLLSARDGIKKHLVSSVLSNPVLTPSHVPMWGCAAAQNRLGNSTNDLPGKSQRAAITCSFADVPLLHGASVWFLSGRPSFSLPPTLTLTSLLSLAHFAVCITYFLSFFLSVPDTSLSACWPACLSLFSVFSRACHLVFLHHTSISSFTFKYVLVGCVSCGNAMTVFFFHKAIRSQVYWPCLSFLLFVILHHQNDELQQLP